MVPQEQPTPDRQTILDHLEHITRRWGELDYSALLEINFLNSWENRPVPETFYFRWPDQVEEAADHIAVMNPSKRNAYVMPNPVPEEDRPPRGRRARKEIIRHAFFQWAEADNEEGANNIRNFVGPKPTLIVITGTTPTVRPHVYWELEDPATDMAAWEAMQKRIAATLKTDSSVTDASRMMRVAGTVNWGKPDKRAKGYIAETTKLLDKRAPRVAADAMARAFVPAVPETGTSTSGDWIDQDRPTAMDRTQARMKALSGEEWHHEVVRLVGSYVAKGLDDEEIHAITDRFTLAGYTVDETRAEVQTAIDGARRKGFAPNAPLASPDAVEKASSGIITGLKVRNSAEFLSDLTPAVYVVDGVLAERRCLSLSGFAGHGKTTLALHLAIEVARGGEFGGQECEQGSVLVLAGENPDNVKWQYAAAIAAADCGNDLPIYFLPGHFQLSAFLDDLLEKARKIPNLRLVVIDSLQAFFEGDNDNANVEMMEAARRFRQLSELDDGPAVVVIAHPAGKRPDKSNIVPRGGSAFGNEFDGNLTVWSEPDGTQTLHHTEKFRGAPFDPITFVMEDREFDHLKDHKGRNLRLKVSRKQLDVEAASAAMRSERRDKDALYAIDATPKINIRNLAVELKVSRSTAGRIVKDLQDDKLIRRHARKWVITDAGKEYLNDD